MSAGGEEMASLLSWGDFVRECFCFGSETMKASGEVMRGLIKSRVEFSLVALLARTQIPPAMQAKGWPARMLLFSFFCPPDEHKNSDWSD